MPTQDEDEEQDNSSSVLAALPLSTVEAAIKSVVQRNNYGLDGIDGAKAPAAVCVWRWEVKEQHRDWLPKNAREKAEVRVAERVQVSASGHVICGLLTTFCRQNETCYAFLNPYHKKNATRFLIPKEPLNYRRRTCPRLPNLSMLIC